jgi:circadian clock protein KaiB
MILFVAGRSPHSQRALANLQEIIALHLPGGCDFQVVDILEEPRIAADMGVLAVPTLVRLSPPPEVRITGSLGNRREVLEALGLVEA